MIYILETGPYTDTNCKQENQRRRQTKARAGKSTRGKYIGALKPNDHVMEGIIRGIQDTAGTMETTYAVDTA
jgi:hypothetical protein